MNRPSELDIMRNNARHFFSGFIYGEEWFLTTYSHLIIKNENEPEGQDRTTKEMFYGTIFFPIREFLRNFCEYVDCNFMPESIHRILRKSGKQYIERYKTFFISTMKNDKEGNFFLKKK
jgi:hypothetical protein